MSADDIANDLSGDGSAAEGAVAGAQVERLVTLIVGMGASAGGLEAFRAFFGAMPTDTGMAFVLVQHLDPDHASALVNILSGVTSMTVSQAQNGDVVAPNHVFVIPPDAILTISGGILAVAQPASAPARRASVNTFFASLADDQGENAVGVILAGYGTDGSAGVEAIKDCGGLTLAQAQLDHAPKPGMPQSAASSGFVDHVLSVEQMPAVLIEHWRYRTKTDGAKGPDGIRQDVGDHLGAICAVLRSRLGRDFSQYKTNTLMRRVQRRMQVLQAENVDAYIELLRERPEEPELLFREILIRVTRFFRDPPAFDALARLVPALLIKGNVHDAVRVWVPGCATGEEVYSIAILFKEALARADQPRKVQIFATDIDDQAITIARAGVYPETIAADLPATLLDQHFIKEGGRFKVSRDLREMCLFSTHDLVKDPPFSRLDLISCRNLMIYFGPVLQKRIIAMFHYGLRPNGLLFLGLSEAVTAHAALFAPLDKKHRLFERRAAPPQIQAITATGSSSPERLRPPVDTADGVIDPRITRVMSQYSPAFVVIDKRHRVQQFSGPIGKYLAPASGAVSLDLSVLVHPDLRAPLRAALKQVAATHGSVIDKGCLIEIAGRQEAVNLVLEPLDEIGSAGDGLLVVAFQDLGAVRATQASGAPLDHDDGSNVVEELMGARERLQTLTEELETSNEELQSSNEEYQSVNEELQSTNEELETSKEELQSINEELATLNTELNARNESLVDVNSDLSNLIDSTSIATLFLDQGLHIRRFTPTVQDLFNVRDGDEGRPITDIASRLAKDGLEGDARQVLRTLIPIQREVSLESGDGTYQMQIRPYRGAGNVINGVVVTFVDVSDRKRTEEDRAQLAAIVSSSKDAIIGHDLAGVVTSWNTGARNLYGYSASEALGQVTTALLEPPGRDGQEEQLLARVRRGEVIDDHDTVQRHKDGSTFDVALSLSPVLDGSGAVIGAARIVRDATSRVRGEKEKALLLGELDHRVKNILAIVSSVVTQTLKGAESLESFAVSMEARIKALSRAHGALTQAGANQTRLETLVRTELAPYDSAGPRMTLLGPEVTLTPRASLALAMAIHELTTNAVKFGALSSPDGRLSVSWEIRGGAAGSILGITWAESRGPTVAPPTKRGFGTTLIERSLAYELDATVTQAFEPSGLRCVIELPFTEDVGRLTSQAVEQKAS